MALFSYIKLMHNYIVPSLFFAKSIGAPQGEIVECIYSFFNNSYNQFFSSFNLGLLTLYGVLDIRVAPGIKLI